MTIFRFAHADQLFIRLYAELVVVGELLVLVHIPDRIDEYTRAIVYHFDSGFAVRLNLDNKLRRSCDLSIVPCFLEKWRQLSRFYQYAFD